MSIILVKKIKEEKENIRFFSLRSTAHVLKFPSGVDHKDRKEMKLCVKAAEWAPFYSVSLSQTADPRVLPFRVLFLSGNYSEQDMIFLTLASYCFKIFSKFVISITISNSQLSRKITGIKKIFKTWDLYQSILYTLEDYFLKKTKYFNTGFFSTDW